MTRTCAKCGVTRPLTEFYRESRSPSGRMGVCIPCDKLKSKAYREANKARISERLKTWRVRNSQKSREYSAEWHKENRADQLEKMRVYKANNPGKIREYNAARKAAKRNAAPAWANKFFMEEAYVLAAIRTKISGFMWHVDHIVPLKSKFVCGLHTHENLQVIPAAENISKGNRRWPDMPTLET